MRPVTTGGAEEVVLDAESHSADAIQRAAYRLSHLLSMELLSRGGMHHCRLFVNETASLEDPVSEFRRTVIDEVLRARIREETAPVRNTILALAFSQVQLDEGSMEP